VKVVAAPVEVGYTRYTPMEALMLRFLLQPIALCVLIALIGVASSAEPARRGASVDVRAKHQPERKIQDAAGCCACARCRPLM